MPSSERYLELADIAAAQWGLLTTRQAGTVNVTPQELSRMATQGILDRLQHGIYRLAGVPHDPNVEMKAAWLALEPGATAADRVARPDPTGVVSHRSAAKLHNIGDLDADINEFTVNTTKRTRHPAARIHTQPLNRADWTLVAGMPTTTIPRTIRDLAAANTDGGHLAGVVRDAITRGHVTYLDTAQLLRPYALDYGAPLGDGRTLLKSLLAQAGLAELINAAAAIDGGDDTYLIELIDQSNHQTAVMKAFKDLAHRITVDEKFLGPIGALRNLRTDSDEKSK